MEQKLIGNLSVLAVLTLSRSVFLLCMFVPSSQRTLLIVILNHNNSYFTFIFYKPKFKI